MSEWTFEPVEKPDRKYETDPGAVADAREIVARFIASAEDCVRVGTFKSHEERERKRTRLKHVARQLNAPVTVKTGRGAIYLTRTPS